FAEGIAARDTDVKLMAVSLAGMDYVFAEEMFDHGLADYASAFALNSGRGNFTPDYAPDPATWDPSANGKYWNFLGAIRKAREMIDERNPGMEIWITEAYACTMPNSWWHDNYRHAAENV